MRRFTKAEDRRIDNALRMIDEAEKSPDYAEMQDGEIVRVYEYHYTGTAPVQIGNADTRPYTVHRDINLTEGPLKNNR